MLDTSTAASRPEHAADDHPAIKPARVGILLANLGTPDYYDYWSISSSKSTSHSSPFAMNLFYLSF